MKVLGKIVAAIYSILFVVLLFALSIGLIASNVFKGDFYSNILKSIDLEEINAQDLGLSEDPNVTAEDFIVDSLSNAGVSKNVAEAILNDNEIKEVLGDVIGKVVNYTVNPREIPTISREEVETVLNNKDVQNLIGGEISGADINELVEAANELIREFCESGGID